MKSGKPWSYDELIIAMNLYCKLPFGKLHSRNPIIIEVAEKLGRTSSSLAMKLVNLASLDPAQKARGIKGLKGASKADQAIWDEFRKNWEDMGVQSEEKFQALFDNQISEQIQIQKIEITEKEAKVKARRGQEFFRNTVLSSYNHRCCITGNSIPELLIASHILPWRDFPQDRLNPENGLCLANTHDQAFDRGLITFNENYELVLSKYLESFLPEPTLNFNFVIYSGKQINLPDKFLPNPNFLAYHRENIFLGR